MPALKKNPHAFSPPFQSGNQNCPDLRYEVTAMAQEPKQKMTSTNRCDISFSVGKGRGMVGRSEGTGGGIQFLKMLLEYSKSSRTKTSSNAAINLNGVHLKPLFKAAIHHNPWQRVLQRRESYHPANSSHNRRRRGRLCF